DGGAVGIVKAGIDPGGQLDFALGLGHFVVGVIEAAQHQVIVGKIGLETNDLLELLDGEAQHLARLRAVLDVAQSANINIGQQLVRLQIIGVAAKHVLGLGNGVAQAAAVSIEFGERGVEELRSGIGSDGLLVFLNGVVEKLRAPVGEDHLLVIMAKI